MLPCKSKDSLSSISNTSGSAVLLEAGCCNINNMSQLKCTHTLHDYTLIVLWTTVYSVHLISNLKNLLRVLGNYLITAIAALRVKV